MNKPAYRSLSPETWFFAGAMAIIFAYLLPYLIWGQDCIVRISDNLDSNVVWNTLMSRNIKSYGWNYPDIPQIMNGISKVSTGTQLNINSLLYLAFPTFTAMVINLFIIHSIAFLGMRALLRRLSRNLTNVPLILIYGVSVCFALLDFWPSGGLSIAGQPLLLYAFIKIRNREESWYDYLIVLLFPFYSSLVLSGAFIISLLVLWIIIEKIRKKTVPLKLYLSVMALILVYLFVERDLVQRWFVEKGYVSHRVEFFIDRDSFVKCLVTAMGYFISGFKAHANVHQTPVILVLIPVAIFIAIRKKSSLLTPLLILLFLAAGLSVIAGFYKWVGIASLKVHYPFVNSFDFSRYNWLLPVTFFLIFFYSLLHLNASFSKFRYVLILVLVIQAGLEIKRNSNEKKLYSTILEKCHLPSTSTYSFTYRQYYSVNLFDEIKEYLGSKLSVQKVVSLGLDPAICLYNGLYTLDGYVAEYPLQYKKAFRKIIARELDKNEKIRYNFDSFGSTCYLFSAELEHYKTYTKNDKQEVNNLEINTKILKEMGGRFILSAVKINNANALGLSPEKTFEDSDSLYRIYLYRIL